MAQRKLGPDVGAGMGAVVVDLVDLQSIKRAHDCIGKIRNLRLGNVGCARVAITDGVRGDRAAAGRELQHQRLHPARRTRIGMMEVERQRLGSGAGLAVAIVNQAFAESHEGAIHHRRLARRRGGCLRLPQHRAREAAGNRQDRPARNARALVSFKVLCHSRSSRKSDIHPSDLCPKTGVCLSAM